jgi:hypothetical protein
MRAAITGDADAYRQLPLVVSPRLRARGSVSDQARRLLLPYAQPAMPNALHRTACCSGFTIGSITERTHPCKAPAARPDGAPRPLSGKQSTRMSSQPQPQAASYKPAEYGKLADPGAGHVNVPPPVAKRPASCRQRAPGRPG